MEGREWREGFAPGINLLFSFNFKLIRNAKSVLLKALQSGP